MKTNELKISKEGEKHMRYYSVTFDSYNGTTGYMHTYSKDANDVLNLDDNGRILIKESEVAQYFEKYNVNRIEYVGTIAE